MVEKQSQWSKIVDWIICLALPIVLLLIWFALPTLLSVAWLFLVHGATESLLCWSRAPAENVASFVQLELLVVCLFSAAVVPFSGERGVFPFGRVTAGLLLSVWVHLLFVCFVLQGWVPVVFSHGYVLQYEIMVATAAFGVIFWWLFLRWQPAKPERELANPVSGQVSQFSILSLLVWSALVASLLYLATSHNAFVALADPDAIPGLAVSGFICSVLLLGVVFPITRWLCRVKFYWVHAAGVWIIAVALVLLGYCLRLAGQSNGFGDVPVVRAIQIGAAIALYLVWVRLSSWVLPLRQARPLGFHEMGCYRGFVAVASWLWLWTIVWSVSHFAVFTSNRYPDSFDSSAFLIERLESTFGSEAVAQVEATAPETMDDWINRLGRLRSPKESDLVYQLSLVSRTKYRERDDFYFSQVGLSRTEIDAIADHTAATWLKSRWEEHVEDAKEMPVDIENFDNLLSLWDWDGLEFRKLYKPWTRKELPLAAEYCIEKKVVLERILTAIDRCESAHFPVTEDGFFGGSTGFNFAKEMLLAQTWFAIGESKFDDVLELMTAQERLSRVIARYPSGARDIHADYRIRASVMDQLLFIAMRYDLTRERWSQFRELAIRLCEPRQVPADMEGEAFVRFALMQRAINANRNQQDAAILAQIAMRCPRSVNWDSYLRELDSRFCARRRVRDVTHAMTSNFAAAFVENDSLNVGERNFGTQLFEFLSLPGGYGRALAAEDESNALFQRNAVLETEFVCRQRLRFLKLGILHFEQSAGRLPATLDELDWIPGITTDPFTGKPFVYTVLSKTRYDVWSCSVNQIDDGGRVHLDLFADGPAGTLSNPPANLQEYLERQ